jgi:hypothetical protein
MTGARRRFFIRIHGKDKRVLQLNGLRMQGETITSRHINDLRLEDKLVKTIQLLS